jgi:hypothetical protein
MKTNALKFFSAISFWSYKEFIKVIIFKLYNLLFLPFGGCFVGHFMTMTLLLVWRGASGSRFFLLPIAGAE